MPPSPDGDPVVLQPIGAVASPLAATADAPRQPDEGAPRAAVVLAPEYEAALTGVAAGDRIVVLTWLHVADRATLSVHPRGDRARQAVGVFATRAPDRPNPVGLHEVTVVAVDGTRVTVDGLEAIDGTPVIDLKPALGPIDDR